MSFFEFNPSLKKKKPEVLKHQLENVEVEHSLDLMPPSQDRADILGMSLEELKEKYSARLKIYTELLHQQRTDLPLDPKKIAKMKEWLVGLNSLDTYIQDHYEGKENTLYEKQISVFEDLRTFIEHGEKEGYVKLPTGVGKTVLFIELIEALNLRTMIVVPTKILVDQTGKKIEQFAPDLDVGKIYTGAKEHGRQVTIITYDSLVNKIRSGEIKPEEFDCLILDEAHRALSDLRIEAIQKFNGALKLGFTATPEFSKEKNVEQILPKEIHSMSIVEAVEGRLLSEFSAVIAKTKIDISSVPINNNGEWEPEKLEEALNIASRNQAAVDLYNTNFKEKTAVVYCTGIKHAEAVVKRFQEQGVSVAMVSGETPQKEQEKILEKLHSGEIKVVVNADLLIEGFDEPRASVCINLRPTRSRVVAEQRAGRVLRLDPDDPNKLAYIVDFLDEIDDDKLPPILFADIATVAHAENKPETEINVTGSDTETNRSYPARQPLILDIPGLEVIVNTEEVMRVVHQLQELEPKHESAPEGWLTNYDLTKAYDFSEKTIKKIAEEHKKIHPEWFKEYSGSQNRVFLYYSPELVDLIIQKLSIREKVLRDG